MMSDYHATKSHVVPKQESHLLKLPQELLDRIYEYALISEASLDVETYAPRRPGLSQVCRRLRNEFRPKYFKLTRFNIIVTVNNTEEVRRWAAAITDEELRSIPSLTFRLRTKYGRLTGAMAVRYETTMTSIRAPRRR
jgi:hypothetical protein